MKKFIKSFAVLLLALTMAVSLPLTVSADLVVDQTVEDYTCESNLWTGWPQTVVTGGRTACLMDAETGTVLYNKGMTAPQYPASTTKIMTALLIIENCPDMNAIVTMTETGLADAFPGSSNSNPSLGEQFTVRQCLEMILVKSANDIATQMAEYVAGSVSAFADMMNARAAQLGCINTHFANASGLEDENHYTCAYDLSLITRAALQYDIFREITGSMYVEIPATNMSDARYYETHLAMINPDMPYYYPYVKGGKTGYTPIARNNLVQFAEKDGRTLICVIMCIEDQGVLFSNMATLFDYGFANFERDELTLGVPVEAGGVALLPNGTDVSFLTNETAEVENGLNVGFLYNGVRVGTAIMTEDNYLAYQQKKSELTGQALPADAQAILDEKEAQQALEEEIKAVESGEDTTKEIVIDEATGEKTVQEKPVNKTPVYIIIVILIAAILFVIYMIYVNIQQKRRRNRRARRRSAARKHASSSYSSNISNKRDTQKNN
jgi:D-alanyl-D-alanine carboxypeptidase (penicillin-binding protein 5/6)